MLKNEKIYVLEVYFMFVHSKSTEIIGRVKFALTSGDSGVNSEKSHPIFLPFFNGLIVPDPLLKCPRLIHKFRYWPMGFISGFYVR